MKALLIVAFCMLLGGALSINIQGQPVPVSPDQLPQQIIHNQPQQQFYPSQQQQQQPVVPAVPVPVGQVQAGSPNYPAPAVSASNYPDRHARYWGYGYYPYGYYWG